KHEAHTPKPVAGCQGARIAGTGPTERLRATPLLEVALTLLNSTLRLQPSPPPQLQGQKTRGMTIMEMAITRLATTAVSQRSRFLDSIPSHHFSPPPPLRQHSSLPGGTRFEGEPFVCTAPGPWPPPMI